MPTIIHSVFLGEYLCRIKVDLLLSQSGILNRDSSARIFRRPKPSNQDRQGLITS